MVKLAKEYIIHDAYNLRMIKQLEDPAKKIFGKDLKTKCQNALVCATITLKSPRNLSIATAIKIFNLKIAPIASYGIELIWQHLSLDNLQTLDSIKTRFLKRVLSTSKFSKNRNIYLLTQERTFIEYLVQTYRLPSTLAYERFLQDRADKVLSIDPDFYDTPAMQCDTWKAPLYETRHCLTRHAMHGFHYVVCNRRGFHEADTSSCVCKFCKQPCALYHFLKCSSHNISLTKAAEIKP